MALLSTLRMEDVAREMLQIPRSRQGNTLDETFRGFLGAPSEVITDLWNRLETFVYDASAQPKHLLWSLLFMKVYATEVVHCRIAGWPDKKTFRKWTWYFVEKISLLKNDIIKLDNRFDKWDGAAVCLMSVDGTDCPVMEPWPFLLNGFAKNSTGLVSSMK